jgi:hypothetical protein
MNKRIIVLAAVLFVPLAAVAGEFQLAGEAAVGVSDNINRTPSNQQSDTLSRLGLQLLLTEQTSRLDADVRGDLAYQAYAKSSYSSEFIGNAGAALKLGLIEDRLSWSLDDTFGQTRRDLFAVVTPLNRENVNYLATGPNLALHLGSTDRFLAQARYVRVDFQTTAYNTQRYSGLVGLEHDLASTSHLALDASQEHVEPDNTLLSAAYDHQELFARYTLDNSRTKLSLDAGASRIARSGANESAALFRLDLSRTVGDISTLALHAGQETTDPGGSLAWAGGAPLPATGTNTQSLALTSNPYVNKYLQLAWAANGHLTSLALSAGWNDEKYQHLSLANRTAYTGRLHAERLMGAHLQVHGDAAVTRYNYANVVGDNTEKDFSLGLAWQMGRKLYLDLSAERFDYSTQLSPADISETRYWLRLRYGLVTSRRAS